MLLFVEHDHVLSTRKARQLFTEVVQNRRDLQVVVFRPGGRVEVEQMLTGFPAALRTRLMVTPSTPRGRGLASWLEYEVGVATAAMRFLGTFQEGEEWCALVPPSWYGVLARSYGEERLMPMPSAFDDIDASRLRAMLRAARPRRAHSVAHRPSGGDLVFGAARYAL